MFTVALVGLSIILGCGLVEGGHESNHLWSIEKPGDIIIHGIFPLRRRHGGSDTSRHRSVFNFEGIMWMGVMIQRISEINRARRLPGNLTIGYSIRDSSCDADIGIKQTLSVANKIINNDRSGTIKRGFHFPVVVGPACDRVESNSHKLLEMFSIPRISYTTTGSRFHYPAGKILRTVTSDLVHVEALLRVLEDMNPVEVTVVASREKLWWDRANALQINMKKRKMPLRNAVIYIDTVNNISDVRLESGRKVVVLFAEASISRMLRKREKRRGVTWIAVNKFDDPLFKVFDENGNVSNKTIIRNARRKDFTIYKEYLIKELQKARGYRTDWIDIVLGKYIQQCRNRTLRHKECSSETFQHNTKSFFEGVKNDFRSSLTLQGVVDAVDLVVNAVKDILKTCGGRNSLSCLRSSARNLDWLKSLRRTKLKLSSGGKVLGFNEHGVLTGKYSIQVLRRTKSVLGRRMMVQKGWVFKKVCEWNITEDLSSITLNNPIGSLPTGGMANYTAKITDNDILSGKPSPGGVQDNKTCSQCQDTGENCDSTAGILDWSNGWAIAVYLVEFIILCAVIANLVFFLKHKHSPIMLLCCSWSDNIILVVLGLFSFLPIVHIGEQSLGRCLILWPAVNVIFAFYTALLLTKTLFVQNLLKCEVATDRPGRRILFSMSIVVLQLIVLITSSILGHPPATRSACFTRGTVIVCDIKGSTGIIFSMALNCFLLLSLFMLAVRETIKQRKNFCRTENLAGVAAVALVCYTCSIMVAYFNLALKHHLLVTLVHCVLYLANPIVCLACVYVPTLRLVSTWLRQHVRQQRNLTSIKRAQVMSAKRQSAGPLADSLFNMNFFPEQSLIPSRQSGYYFDMRPGSPVTGMSYPNSLVRSVHEPTRVVFGYGRSGTILVDDSADFQSETSMEDLETMSCDSFYDNISTSRGKRTPRVPPPQELLREITSHWGGATENDNVFINRQCEENEPGIGETNKWPSLEGLRASDL